MRAQRGQWGGILLEGAIGIPLILLFIFFVVDAGRFLFYYARLTYVASEVTRSVAIGVGRAGVHGGCGELQSVAEGEVEEYFTDHGALDLGFEQREVEVTPSSPYPVLRITLAINVECLMCRIVAEGKALTSSSLLVVESASTGCEP